MDPQTPPSVVPDEQAAPAVETNVRQQIASSIQAGKNVLVTVKSSPSVDELASALGLTFLLGKLDKHATAVFSGKIPSAMEFLDPENIFENSVDSLRDFIIALDKEKADKLRYKVEDDVVKVFITPYKTIISEKDLAFSQGDFNVDVVIALGVTQREELDKAILAHGRILHDATVITLNAGPKAGGLGSIDWHDEAASSIAEMLVNLNETLGTNTLDSQISTAFLTGVVAETNRFSNDKTSPKVMNIAAQLMAAGANQQLIATNLRQEGMISEPVRTKKDTQPHDDGGEMVLEHKSSDTEEAGSKDLSDSKKSPDTAPKKSTAKKSPEDKTKDTPPSLGDDLKKALDTASENQPNGNSPVVVQSKKPEDEAEPATAKDMPTQRKHKVIEPLPDMPASPAVSTEPPELPSLNFDEPRQPSKKTESDEPQDTSSEEPLPSSGDTSGGPETAQKSVDDARRAVEEAALSEPFNPANKPLESINAAALPSIESDKSIDSTVSQAQTATAFTPPDEPDPMESFMQPQNAPNELTEAFKLNPPGALGNQAIPSSSVQEAGPTGMPPLPPLPATSGGGMPPLPPLSGQPVHDPAVAVQPQINPSFMQNMPQSQNSWTQAGDDIAAKQAEKEAARQQKMDQMSQQYDQAQDRQRELQGLPPLNNPNGSGLPPVPPQS